MTIFVKISRIGAVYVIASERVFNKFFQMDNKQFIMRLAKRMSLDYKETSDLTQAVVALLGETMAVGDKVAIPGFGTFSTVKYDETISIDHSTGKRMLLPPLIEPRFEGSAILMKHIER